MQFEAKKYRVNGIELNAVAVPEVFYDRLSAVDRTLLDLEDANTHIPAGRTAARDLPAGPRLRGQQALSVGLFGYNGVLHWAFTADWDALPDLHDIVLDVRAEFDALRRAASS